MPNGWEQSAAAWIRDLGELGDFGRRFVMDAPMRDRVAASGAKTALDVGCGEGRFCRIMRGYGIDAIGVDSTRPLLDAARRRDAEGTYLRADAERLPFVAAAFDLVVSYLSLVDIPDLHAAIPEMVRVLKPGGRLLIANLNGFNTAGLELGWQKDMLGRKVHFAFDHYLRERAVWCEWRGIRILNYHRPLSVYMRVLLDQGLTLTHFDEPPPVETAPSDLAAHYRRAPWFVIMEWRKAE